MEPIIQAMQAIHLPQVASVESTVQSFPWTKRNFADGLLAGYPAYVACVANKVVAYYMVLIAPDTAHLLVIGVAPEYQNKGLGKALLKHCENTALAAGLNSVLLEVRVSNHNAIGFYKRMGYAVIASRKGYYPAAGPSREDALVMSRQLVPVAG